MSAGGREKRVSAEMKREEDVGGERQRRGIESSEREKIEFLREASQFAPTMGAPSGTD